jgi:hypothetical protein
MKIRSKSKNILAIDPANEQSAYVVMDNKFTPLQFGKIDNDELLSLIPELLVKYQIKELAIEMIASYGMSVGKTVFDTCLWIGRFIELCVKAGINVTRVYRKEVAVHICGSVKANDTNVRTALIDRFAKHDFKNGKGTKDNQDFFYGFKADCWAAYGVGLTFLEGGVKEPCIKK